MFDDTLEKISARFVSEVALVAPEGLISAIFASPLSARSPDTCLLWHFNYRKKYGIILFLKYIVKIFIAFPKSVARLIKRPFQLMYTLCGEINGSILVIPSICSYIGTNGRYATPYIATDNESGLFIFGPNKAHAKNVKRVKPLRARTRLMLTHTLMKGGIHAFKKVKARLFDKSLLLLEWCLWVLSDQWLQDYYLERCLSDIVKRYDIKKVGCIHEMHSYARVVWHVADKHDAISYTIQHATIGFGKRWYFSYPEEKRHGLKLPNVMYVYSREVVDTLKPFFENTKFMLGCNARYTQWKDATSFTNKGKYYLFIGGLAAFDNQILIASLRVILNANRKEMPIKVRLHEFAKLRYRDKQWIDSSAKNGIITIAEGVSLKEDIEDAILVVGANTTTLLEAILLGRPAVQIEHPDYLPYIEMNCIRGGVKKGYSELSAEYLAKIANVYVNCKRAKELLGLFYPEVTYERLFSNN